MTNGPTNALTHIIKSLLHQYLFGAPNKTRANTFIEIGDGDIFITRHSNVISPAPCLAGTVTSPLSYWSE